MLGEVVAVVVGSPTVTAVLDAVVVNVVMEQSVNVPAVYESTISFREATARLHWLKLLALSCRCRKLAQDRSITREPAGPVYSRTASLTAAAVAAQDAMPAKSDRIWYVLVPSTTASHFISPCGFGHVSSRWSMTSSCGAHLDPPATPRK